MTYSLKNMTGRAVWIEPIGATRGHRVNVDAFDVPESDEATLRSRFDREFSTNPGIRRADGTVYNVTSMADTKAAAEEYAAAVAAVIGCAVIWDSERGVV